MAFAEAKFAAVIIDLHGPETLQGAYFLRIHPGPQRMVIGSKAAFGTKEIDPVLGSFDTGPGIRSIDRDRKTFSGRE